MSDIQHLRPRAILTRSRLREAAIAVFARKGFHETKVSDIVAEAGVSQPTFYLYFDSKEAAFDAFVEEFRAALRDATQACLISPGVTPRELYEDMRASFTRYFTVLAAEPALTEIGFFQRPSGEVTKEQMIEWTIANMEQEQRAGILRADIPVAYQARLVIGLIDQMARLISGIDTVPELSSVSARLFCDALAER